MAPPLLKPPARARRIRALRPGPHPVLTPPAISELFRHLELFTEGGLSEDAEPRWFGSTMVSFDLDRMAGCCRGLDSDADMARFVDAIEGSVRVRLKIHRLACAEIYRRFPDHEVGRVEFHSHFHRQGGHLLLDIDLEAPLHSRRGVGTSSLEV